MNVRDQRGKLVAQKYRARNKQFVWASDTKDHPLYGMWLWPSKGKSVVVTEGELDAISVSKAFGHKWPVVSLPDGTGSVRKALSKAYDWLDGFEKIVLWFDGDEVGQKAMEQAIEILPVGKVHIARSPEGCKDANDVLRQYGTSAVSKCYWDASLYKPDGIVAGSDFDLDHVRAAVSAGYPWPWPGIQSATYGLREGEITLLTAGSGIGKSTLARELAYHLRVNHGCKVGNIFLEESNAKTVQGYVAIHNNVPLGQLRYDPSILTDDQWTAGLRAAIWDGMWFYNHFGSLAADSLISKIGFMRKACGCNFVILDHVSIVTSGLESSSEGERKDIDILMTRLRQCAEATGVGIIGVVHLKRVKDLSFNDGGQVSLTHLRGSAALEQLSDNVIALERNQQAEDEREKNQCQMRILKCRETGASGAADLLEYNRETGRLELTSVFSPIAQSSQTEMHTF